MTYRKGELSRGRIDREWPYQVTLPASFVSGPNGAYATIAGFALTNSLSLCDRRHTFFQNDEHWIVYCFADQDHADRFLKEFNGEVYVKPGRKALWK